MIEQPKGLLPVVHFDAEHSWDSLPKAAGDRIDSRGLERLKNLLGDSVATVMIERHYLDRDYRDTFSGFHSKKFVTPDARTIRLHFFRKPVTLQDVRANDALVQENYIGYSVVRPTWPNCTGRTFLDPTKINGVKGTMCRCEERTSIQGTELNVTGFPFISQDGDVTVCAEASTWMVMRYFSNRFASYREFRPFELTRLIPSRPAEDRAVASHGLHLWEIAATVRNAGFSPKTYTRDSVANKSPEPQAFEDLLYMYVESGFPVFMALDRHVVVAIGHISDYERTPPRKENPVKSSFYNRGFIINDDNTYPYQRLEGESESAFFANFLKWPRVRRDPLLSSHTLNDINAFMVPMPEKVFCDAEAFASQAKKLLFESPLAYTKFSPELQKEPLIMRTFLTTCKSFKQRIIKRKSMGNQVVADVYYELPMPHFIWVCELSTPGLYKARNHHILGEIIWDATRNAYEHDAFLALHYPEKLWVDFGSALNQKTNVQRWDLNVFEPYPVFTSNLLEI